MTKYLYVPMETKCREHPGRTLLALKAAQRGLTVFLGESTVVQALAFAGPTGGYLGTSVLEGHRPLYERLRAAGQTLLSTDEEGLIYYNKENFLDARINTTVINMLDAFFLWGRHHQELALSKQEFRHLHVVGNPRIEILKNKYRAIFKKKVANINERFGNFILLNTNFGSVNHYLGQEYSLKIAKSLINFSQKDEEFQSEKLRHKKVLMAHFMEFVKKITQKYPDRNVIVRPHPSENRATWEQIQRDNLHVINEGSVIPWLLSASALVQQNCTTAIEALLLGTPTITFNPVYDERFDSSILQSMTRKCQSVDELVDAVSVILETQSKNDATINVREAIKVLDYYIANLDDESDCFEDMLSHIERTIPNTSREYGQSDRLKMLLQIKQSHNAELEDYYTNKFDALPRHELVELVNILEHIEPWSFRPLTIKEVYPKSCTCLQAR